MAEKRKSFALFINTTPKSEAKYELVGDGVTELTINYNPQTSTEQFIHQDVATTDITSYQPNAPVTSQVVKEDPAFEYVNGIREELPVGSGAYTDIVMVDTYADETGGAYPATKQPVSIQIDTYGGASTDPLSIDYTLNWRGTGQKGTFNPTTKAFTPGGALKSNYNAESKTKQVEV